MLKRRILPLISLFLFIWQTSLAQDTIRVMQYNLMFYGLYTDFCTASNNNADDKDEYLKTILGHFQPDIFAVNELGRGAHNLTRIKDNVLNADGLDYYEHATYTNTGNDWFANGFFYDTRKFGLYKEVIVNTLIRDINLYTLYYKSDELASGGDTLFLTCLVTHLKAGNTVSDQQTRSTMVNNAMSYLQANNYRGNIMFMGDFNMKSSYEQAYQQMIYHSNENIRFYDPINIEGQWGNNPEMAAYHTQSPRTGSHDCFVTGGLDDRYDFILATKPIMQGLNGLKYIEDSYQAIGQDGNRYNQSLINPVNYSQPQEVINALYEMSDHLPVMMDMVTGTFTNNLAEYATLDIAFNNPVSQNLIIRLDGTASFNGMASIYSMTGSLIDQRYIGSENLTQSLEFSIEGLPSGIYLLKILTDNGSIISRKIVKL